MQSIANGMFRSGACACITPHPRPPTPDCVHPTRWAQSLVRRMIFVVELLANQADLARKVREASALRKALDVPGGVERETGIKARLDNLPPLL